MPFCTFSLRNCQGNAATVSTGIPFLVKDEILIVVDELFRKLPEGQVFRLEFGFNELAHGTAGKSYAG